LQPTDLQTAVVYLQMTVAEATQIADNALEHSVRSILQAVQVRPC